METEQKIIKTELEIIAIKIDMSLITIRQQIEELQNLRIEINKTLDK